MKIICQILLILTQIVLFQRYMCFINSDEYAYLEQNEPFSILKTLICRNIPFKANSLFTGKQCSRC
jgi:hypothetical protein